ncbi:hypothetical protein OS190_16955 [Sulfitobacter sp. F26204]|uniref:VOC family protein n=1 Tax=Sulfitobacter sp. F26204 TaxID=2996014 RepID=UPI00225DF7D7|nr:VOC family protein [Sulfitobacter sp. F26204]MCX7561260.1 hypothetical protein [Sulfitobacter sp. F26204]
MVEKKDKVAPVPRGFRSVTPHIIAASVEDAVAMYKTALDAKLMSSQTVPDTETIIFAKIKIGNSLLTIGQGQSYGVGSVSLHLYVEDAKSTWENAIKAGFTVTNPLKERYWGDLTGLLSDPLGVQWSIGQRVAKLSAKEQRGKAQEALEAARKLRQGKLESSHTEAEK